jgi:dTDP-4-amino-4,6-dideoxygalactose transaminase
MAPLALFGGAPLRDLASPLEDPWPETSPEDMAAVQRVFASGRFTGLHDPEVEAFEAEYASWVGAEHALALGTGTAALHAAVAAAGCQPGDEVIVPALTFLASASAVLHHVCIPVFADIDPRTYNIDPASAAAVISPRTRAIMAVDLHGLPADYTALRAIAQKHNLVLISDAAHAIGAEYQGRRVGSLADITAASIMPAKQLATCGEGGMFSTDQEEYINRASMVRMFGEVIQRGQARLYNAYTLGWNYRLNPVQAAYARSQLARLADNAAAFSANGAHLTQSLSDLPGLIPPYIPPGSTHIYHMYRMRFDPAVLGSDLHPGRFAQAVSNAMAAEGLPLRFYQMSPVPGQMVFRLKEGFGRGIPWTLPGARQVDYDLEAYPATLDVLESTRCLGNSGTSGPNYFRNRATLDLYIQGFHKVWSHLPRLFDYAKTLDYQPPWTSIALSTRGSWTVLSPRS